MIISTNDTDKAPQVGAEENIHAVNVYAPNDVTNAGIEQARKAKEYSAFGIELDIPGTDPAIKDYFAPLLPWEICAIQAQTSNGKTMFKSWWLRKIAQQLSAQERTNEVIVDVVLEESIEAVAFGEMARILGERPADLARGQFDDVNGLLLAKSEIDGIPIWRIGRSAKTPRNAPQLTLSNIHRALQGIKDGSITGTPQKLAVTAVDYLQILALDPETQKVRTENKRRLQVDNDVARLRDMTTELECPIIVPLQAKQELQNANPPYMIPGMYDGLETSGIATRFDRIISLWMPKVLYAGAGKIWNKDNTKSVQVREDGAFLKVVKQRGGLPAGMVWELTIDYSRQEYVDAYWKGGSE